MTDDDLVEPDVSLTTYASTRPIETVRTARGPATVNSLLRQEAPATLDELLSPALRRSLDGQLRRSHGDGG